MKGFGDFNSKLCSTYDFRTWSNINIECSQYSTFCKIIEAITPILEDEEKEMKEYFGEKE